MGNSTKLGALAGEERLPPWRTTLASMLRGPIDQLGSVLIRAHEQDLLLAVEVNNGVLDTWADRWQEKIHDRVNVLLESHASLVLLLGVEEDDTLGSALGDILVLPLLCVGQTVVLVEHSPRVDRERLAIPRLDDTDTATRDIAEAEMEATGLRADDEEHAEQWLRVLDRWQERWVQAEAQGDLGGGEEVSLQDRVVEGAESIHDKLLVLVVDSPGNEVLEGLVAENIDWGRGDRLLRREPSVEVSVGEARVEGSDEIWVLSNDLQDISSGESLGTKTALDVGEDLGVGAVCGVQSRNQRGVLGSQSVEEVLHEHPHAVTVDGLLQAQTANSEHVLELVLGDTVQQRDLANDVADGGINRRELGVGLGSASSGLQVDRDDGDAVGELLDVLPGAGDTVVMVQITQGAEKAHGSALAERNNQTLLLGSLNVKGLNNGTCACNSHLNDVLVDLHRVLCGLGQEAAVTNDVESGVQRVGIRVNELALVDEVAAHRRGGRWVNLGWRAESLDSESPVLVAAVEVLGLESLLIPWAAGVADTGLAGIDVDGMICGLHVESDLLALIFASRRSDLGGVERGDVALDGLGCLGLEVDIVDAKVLVEPLDLDIDVVLGDPGALDDQSLD